MGLYGSITGAPIQEHSWLLQKVEAFGVGLAVLAAVGIGLRMARNALAPEEEFTAKFSRRKDNPNG